MLLSSRMNGGCPRHIRGVFRNGLKQSHEFIKVNQPVAVLVQNRHLITNRRSKKV